MRLILGLKKSAFAVVKLDYQLEKPYL